MKSLVIHETPWGPSQDIMPRLIGTQEILNRVFVISRLNGIKRWFKVLRNSVTAVHGTQTRVNVYQGSIQAVRSNWRWMSKLLKCADVHLQNAADYHQVI